MRVPRLFPSLRHLHDVIADALRKANRCDFRILEYSIQLAHIHLVIEADTEAATCRGMRGLMIRLAKALNRRLRRHGKVFADRWYGRELRTPREIRNALIYVMFNRNHHAPIFAGPDPCSSAFWFTGWTLAAEARVRHALGPPTVLRPTVDAETWLARIGWKKHGLVAFDQRPRGAC